MFANACVLWFGWVLPVLAGVNYGNPSAVLWEDQVFAVTGESHAALGSLYRGQLAPNQPRVHSPLEYWQGGWRPGLVPCSQAKLEIRDNRLLWFSAGANPLIIPLTELAYLERSEFGVQLCRTRKRTEEQHDVVEEYSGWVEGLLFPPHRKPDVPAPPSAHENYYQSDYIKQFMRELEYRQHARFDVQIAGPKSVRLLHAHKDKLFVSIEPDYLKNWYRDEKGNVRKNLPKPPERELRTGKLPADFTERFAAYTADKRDYLVTANGKLYLSMPKGKAEVEVTKVWDDPKRKIVGVVQDLENNAIYGWGFVTISIAPERFYVKFAPKPVAVEYKRTVPLWVDFSDAYLESYECARAFRTAAEKK